MQYGAQLGQRLIGNQNVLNQARNLTAFVGLHVFEPIKHTWANFLEWEANAFATPDVQSDGSQPETDG